MPKFSEDEFKAKLNQIRAKLETNGQLTERFDVYAYLASNPQEKPANITNWEALVTMYKAEYGN